MATDLSAAAAVAQGSDPSPQPITNGDDAPASSEDAPGANQDSFMENSALDTSSIAVKDAPADPNPAGPTPIDDVAEGIQPVADFIPKDAPTHSHPTPPPDQPLDTGDADVDTAMANVDDVTQPSSAFIPPPASAPVESEPVSMVEPSLVRPREDDVDDEHERAAKRSRFDAEVQPETEVAESAAAPGTSQLPPAAPPEPTVSNPAPQTAPSSEPTPAVLPIEPPAPLTAPPSAEQPAPPAHSELQPPPAVSEAKSSIEPQSATGTPAPTSGAQHSTAPMTELQKRALLDKMKNLKKTRNAVYFLKPVDVVALNIPTYPDIIKQPMDLGTMEQKLKSDQYGSVQDVVNDFELIIHNTRVFNGEAHTVTQTGMSMKAYFDKMMMAIPSADQVPPPKVQQKRASPPRQPPQRREHRAPPPPPPAAAPAPASTPKSEAYALPPDGVPQIRRESTNGRPARAIKPPANRDIPYAKPKRKEHQLELRFCEHVLDQIRSPRYAQVNGVFLMPVDPVALNIPHYRQVVKHPMDLSTMAQKLKQGEYGKASEFRKDFDLMIDNCLAFNPQGNLVRDMGIQFRRHFEELWRGKDKWERANKPESARHTSASADEDSDVDEDADDDEPEDDKQQTIEALQKQLADMQNLISGMASGGAAKPKKEKKAKVKDAKRKIGSLSSAVPKPKSSAPKPKKPAKQKQVTYEEKQEISEAVGRMDDGQVSELTRIITENVPKYRDQDDMELEIDDLPNHVQLMLLRYVRKLFGKPKGAEPMSPPDDGEIEDDDFEPPERGGRGSGGMAAAGKRKKHKPMGKREQQEKIEQLNSKLEQFKQVGTSGSESPTGASSFNPAKAESSGDDESEESEEE